MSTTYADRATAKRQRNAKRPRRDDPALAQQAKATDAASPSASSASSSPRHWTVSIAVPGDLLASAKTPEFKTHLVGAVARAAALYRVDEIVVFRGEQQQVRPGEPSGEGASTFVGVSDHRAADCSFDAVTFMARLLQYLETPPYLRKQLFPVHRDLQFAGLLNPLDCPHHTRNYEQTPFREGLVLGGDDQHQQPTSSATMHVVPNPTADIGMHTPCIIDRKLPPQTRVTVQLAVPYRVAKQSKLYSGRVVSPHTPRLLDGTYWGYSTRIASTGLGSVFTECPFDGGYDLTVGVSHRSGRPLADLLRDQHAADEAGAGMKPFKHALIVFGGVHGLEACVDGDSTLTSVSADTCSDLFDWWMDPCPGRGSRTLRPEESLLIALESLRETLHQRGTSSSLPEKDAT